LFIFQIREEQELEEMAEQQREREEERTRQLQERKVREQLKQQHAAAVALAANTSDPDLRPAGAG
jgi:hypothetical protein